MASQRFQFKGKSLLFGLVLLTIIIPPQIIFIPTYLCTATTTSLD